MHHLDLTQREKWPSPNPGPTQAETDAQVSLALDEVAGDPLRAKTRAALALLRREYGEPNWPVLDPMGTLIEILLSHRTADPQTWAAFNELRRRFPAWEGVRDAPVKEIAEAIQGTTWPEQKAPRLKAVLRKITEERGSLDLSFLYDMSLGEADAWLQSLGGVGPKTAACVLLFACHRPILPVDTHLHRVGIRLGLLGPKVDANDAHAILLSLLPDPSNERDVLAFHRDMLLHGQRICVWRDPHCAKCVVRDWCDYFVAHPEKQVEARGEGIG